MTSEHALSDRAKKITLKPSTLLAPVPVVLISCQGGPASEQQKPNLITVAWTGTLNSEPPMVSISIRKSRYSHALIMDSQEFVINLVDETLLKATDFCGVRSGREIDKFAACELTCVPANGLDFAPAVLESPINLACKVKQVIELNSHDVFIGEIVDVQVRANLFDKENRLHFNRARLVAYAHGNYYQLGNQLGFFGYSVARQEVLKKRMPKEPAAPHKSHKQKRKKGK